MSKGLVMKEKEMNFLESDNMRQMPFDVPAGYFESLQTRLEAIPAAHPTERRVFVPLWQKISPYLALAACFLSIVFVGNFFLSKQSVGSEDASLQAYQQFIYADLTPVTNPYVVFDDEDYYTETADEDDIVNYLISSGTSSDLIAYALYNY